jgi:UDP-glucose:tetrahydrobiopterin glucosyltransferase|tara:strand:- start:190 stop:708 length:519 start_codon:yes stop_codon:yes gene_type:complete
LGWAGRIAPEKGLEDAARAAAALGESLLVWGLREDPAYAAAVEAMVPSGTIQWRGFQPTHALQQQLGSCRALINTPKWNEAYGNVVVEALACGVPVVAYDRGGPGELVISGETGWLVPPDDVQALVTALRHVDQIDRFQCRAWAERNATCEVFSARVDAWIRDGLEADVSIS